MVHSILGLAFVGLASAGKVLWDGRFNDLDSSKELDKWSWSNQVGPYQYYIHGDKKDASGGTKYVELSPNYKNPADSSSAKGVKITIDNTAKWNGSPMLRTELIPSPKAFIEPAQPINKGKVFYHFSMKIADANKPSVNHEHQVNFFESHFVEMKYGWVSGEQGISNPNLQFMIGGQSKWKVEWKPQVWHNIAYEIDFSGGSVSFWHSTGSEPLKMTAGPFKTSTSSNGADWHLGVLRLPRSGYDSNAPEDWYFSGVYVESGPITTAVTGPSSGHGKGT
ncbi:hypothetical protein EJ08DRAFT_685015 [Tothia fuscella]|uniref:Glycoside hydrolase 131 catalytic N-terminal domain-containing protein n=1 Tax=Tothia fuscella TaxID=1048955 RepID=A0A9P4P0T1_9PEZI|nr:hypothetical protein EJ08DRAFT_685015 [Tothia fuscella]